MKKLIFALLLSLTLCLGATAQTDERTIEVIPTVSAVGGLDGISLNTELIIAKRFTLTKNHKWFLYGQLGTMYNLYQTEVKSERFSEWQLGLEPMVGIGTNRFRLSGFLNGLAVKDWDTNRMPFVEGGVRFSITPWRKLWLSVFGTWPISDPVFVNYLGETYYENIDGVFLVNSEKWARQVKSYGADIDVGIGKKMVLNLDGFATNNENYQLGVGLQYRLFKNKPWILGGAVNYTNFKNNEYYYIHNIFPGMFGENIEGYTFKLGIGNYGGLADLNFGQMLGRIAEPMYFSPIQKEIRTKATKINEAFKFEPCAWGGECLNFTGSLCITGGKAPYKIFVNWGEGATEAYNVLEMGPYPIKHSYLDSGEYHILISGMDALGKTHSYSGKFVAEDCSDNPPPPPPPPPPPCTLCGSIFFHRFSSQVDNWNQIQLNCGDLNLPYTLYNSCKTEAFNVGIHWVLETKDRGIIEGEYVVHVPKGADPLNLVFKYNDPTDSTCYQKLSLYIMGCTKY